MSKKRGGSRDYSKQTLKILFALSGNKCAHPDCQQELVEPATKDSGAVPTGEICHIYALAEDGPRGKSNLTPQELNSPDNLILLCPTHHRVIDGQHESYPAEMLKEWKRRQESESREKLSPNLELDSTQLFSYPHFPTELVDLKIADEVEKLRKCRIFREFDRSNAALSLGERVVFREFSGGTDQVRSQALAWCARTLAGEGSNINEAEKYIDLATQLGTNPEVVIARAFVHSRKEGRAAGLRALSELDSPTVRTAAFMIASHHDGEAEAISWLDEADIQASDLDSDGKTALLAGQLALGQWEASVKTLRTVSSEDLRKTPSLCHIAAMTELLSIVPVDSRMMVLQQVPIEISYFPLVANTEAMTIRRKLIGDFRNAAEVARQLELPQSARTSEDYALWIELLDPELRSQGRFSVEKRLRDPSLALGVVHLAVQLGIELDASKIERDIQREMARSGGMTLDASCARLGLALMQNTPKKMAEYLALHQPQLSTCVEKSSLLLPQITLFADSGMPAEAFRALEELVETGISKEQERYLRRFIEESEGRDMAAARKEQFETTRSVQDLVLLVNELETKQQWSQVCHYGGQLFDITGGLKDAERLAFALSRMNKSEALLELFGENLGLLSQSRDLRVLYAWSLYQEGRLLEARAQLAELHDYVENQNYRALKANLAIAMGDGIALTSFLDNEYQNQRNRSAQELIAAANLAFQAGFRYSKNLLFAAAEKADKDPNVLLAAYALASSAGLEDNSQVAQWIRRAAELSDTEEGPVRMVGIKEIVAMKPEWDRLESDTWKRLVQGEVALFLAAEQLNRTLTDLTICSALANLTESDPRRHAIVPAYAGNRASEQLSEEEDMVVGIDATALLTLSFLGISDKSLDAFKTVYVPHSTLAWLFQERQRVTFHQPSRIKSAHRIRDLLATGNLQRFVSSSTPDRELSGQVGEELAVLIAQAQTGSDEHSQYLVVRPSPVYRVASLMEEEADLSAHGSILSGCLAVVEKLKEKGQITREEEAQARAYLQIRESPWPEQPEISDGATLYLDGLAATYFEHLGFLDKLRSAGLTAVLSPSVVSEGDALISFEHISEQALGVIDDLQGVLSSGIESGRIKVGRKQWAHERDKEIYIEHPTMDLISIASDFDAAIMDDRFVNQHRQINEGDEKLPIFSTLDLLDALVRRGVVSEDERLTLRTKLRRGGYAFVPIEEKELALHLKSSAVDCGQILEAAELKAIRESLLRLRMGNWLQIPREAHWLSACLQAFINVLKSLWQDGGDISDAAARSNWIVDQIDSRGWAHRLNAEDGNDLIRRGQGLDVLRLLVPPLDVSREIRDAYWKWMEEKVLSPLKIQSPELFDELVEHYRQKISEISEVELPEWRHRE